MTPLHVFILLNVQHLYVRKMQWGTEEYKMRYKVLWLYVIWFMWHFLFSIRSPFCCCIHFLLYCFVFNVWGGSFVCWWVCLFVSCDIQCINLCLVLTVLELDILLTPPPVLNCANFCVGFLWPRNWYYTLKVCSHSFFPNSRDIFFLPLNKLLLFW